MFRLYQFKQLPKRIHFEMTMISKQLLKFPNVTRNI